MTSYEEQRQRVTRLAATVIAARAARGWSSPELARRAALAESAVARVQKADFWNGDRPSAQTAAGLEHAFQWPAGCVGALLDDGTLIVDELGAAWSPGADEQLMDRLRQLATAVADARTARGWREQDLAHRTGRARSTIRGVEAGHAAVGHHSFGYTAEVLEEAFGWPAGRIRALVEEGTAIVDEPVTGTR